jgi:hypothetical protein
MIDRWKLLTLKACIESLITPITSTRRLKMVRSDDLKISRVIPAYKKSEP